MQDLSRRERVVLWMLGTSMVAIGISHFTNPEPFIRIVPDYLPAAAALVLVSGAFEIAGGLGVLVRTTRRAAAWGLILLFVAVFPANVNMAMNGIQLEPENPVPIWALWARLPFQVLFIGTAWWFTRRSPTVAASPAARD